MSKFRAILQGAALSAALAAQTAQAETRDLSFQGDHGCLAAIAQYPKGRQSYPMVLLLHGFTSAKEDPLIEAVASELEARGIASLRFDFNGHGQSEGRVEDMTIPNEIEDAKRALAFAASLPGVTKVAVAGHSQGGVVAAMLAGECGKDRIRAAALLAPAAVLQDDIRKGRWFDAEFDPANLPETLTVLGHPVGREYLKTAMDLPIYETAAACQGPVRIIQGTADPVVPVSCARGLHEAIKGSELVLLDGFDHSFTQDFSKAAKAAADFLAHALKE